MPPAAPWLRRAAASLALGTALLLAPALWVAPSAGAATPVAAGVAFPGASRSHYLTVLNPDLLAAQGREDAQAAARAGLSRALVVLDAGTPAAEDGSVTRPDSRGRGRPEDLRLAVDGYAAGWMAAPMLRRPDLLVVLATNNAGRHVSRAHGMAWARLVQVVAHDLPGIDVRGGLDAELEYNGPGPTLAWVDGYRVGTDRPYVDVGSCTCPPLSRPPGGWSLEDLYALTYADGRASVLPQIYATGGGSAKEWAVLAQWSAVAHPGRPVRLLGVLTEAAACAGPPARPCAGIGNPPEQAWRQLTAEAPGARLAYASDIGYLPRPPPANGPARVALAALGVLLAAGLAAGALLAWRRPHLVGAWVRRGGRRRGSGGRRSR